MTITEPASFTADNSPETQRWGADLNVRIARAAAAEAKNDEEKAAATAALVSAVLAKDEVLVRVGRG